jgi:cation transport regulator
MAIKIKAKADFAAGPVVLQRIPGDAVSPKIAAGLRPSRIELDLTNRGKTVTAPSVLPGHAQEIWRSTFLSAWGDTCKGRSGDSKESCAASVAWSAVKRSFRKSSEGKWVEKTFAEVVERADYPWDECIADQMAQYDNMEKAKKVCGSIKAKYGGSSKSAAVGFEEFSQSSVPLPDEVRNSPFSVALIWLSAYLDTFSVSKSTAEAASHGWATLKGHCLKQADGTWTEKSANDISNGPASEDAAETEMVEQPVVERSLDVGVSYRSESGPIVVDGIKASDYLAVIKQYGNEWAARPEFWPWEAWADLDYTRKTVGSVLRHIMECRAYSEAVKRTSMRGWYGEAHPNGSGEVIFRGWMNVGMPQQFFGYAVLVCRDDEGASPEEWVLSVHRETPLIARAVPGTRRFRGPMINSNG